MKTLSILSLAAALSLPTAASAIPYTAGLVSLLPEAGSYTEDPEYQKLLAEEKALFRGPYTPEYAEILAANKALERYQAGEKASSLFLDLKDYSYPIDWKAGLLKEDFLKGKDAPTLNDSNAEAALKSLEAGIPAEEAAQALAAGKSQAPGEQGTAPSIEELTSAINDYNTFLEAAREEGVPVGKGYTITTYKDENGQLMCVIDTPNSCGIPFPASNPPADLKAELDSLKKATDKGRKAVAAAVAAAKERTAKAQEEAQRNLEAANNNMFNPLSVNKDGKSAPAPGEKGTGIPPGETPSATADKGGDLGSGAPGDWSGITASGSNVNSAAEQTDMIVAALQPQKVVGIDARQASKGPLAQLTFEGVDQSKTLVLLHSQTQKLPDMTAPAEKSLFGPYLLEGIRSHWDWFFELKPLSPKTEVNAVPDEIMKPTAPSTPGPAPAENKGA